MRRMLICSDQAKVARAIETGVIEREDRTIWEPYEHPDGGYVAVRDINLPAGSPKPQKGTKRKRNNEVHKICLPVVPQADTIDLTNNEPVIPVADTELRTPTKSRKMAPRSEKEGYQMKIWPQDDVRTEPVDKCSSQLRSSLKLATHSATLNQLYTLR